VSQERAKDLGVKFEAFSAMRGARIKKLKNRS
jgi:hypothetical protein